jgi:hypothetical protein
MKELCQFHVLRCFTPKDPKNLSHLDCCNALTSLMFLMEKWSGKIKARGYANGSKQHQHIAKDEAMAPTVSSDAISFKVPSLPMNVVMLLPATFLVPSYKQTTLIMS